MLKEKTFSILFGHFLNTISSVNIVIFFFIVSCILPRKEQKNIAMNSGQSSGNEKKRVEKFVLSILVFYFSFLHLVCSSFL